jgi:hypothetical protein
VSESFITLAVQLAFAGLLYIAVFVGIAIGRDERQLYVSKIRELIGTRHRQSSAAALSPRASI